MKDRLKEPSSYLGLAVFQGIGECFIRVTMSQEYRLFF